MVIIRIIGGLGNQMFQYAYAKALQKKGYNVKIDITAFETYKLHGGYQLNKFDLDLKEATKEEIKSFYKKDIISQILNRLNIKHTIIKEKGLSFKRRLLKPSDNTYIQGYFQSEKYLSDITNINEIFTINNPISNYSNEIEKDILDSNNSCSMHIRRGDYINDPIFEVCEIDYYEKAMKFMEEKIGNITYFVFSNDIKWVKKNIKAKNIIYINSEEPRIPHEDILLMSLCKNNIIANSSFSWWGAYLNQNKEKLIVAPKKWFKTAKKIKQSKDLVPKSWIRL
ncbi:MAG: alpha-1,2-fucosyltransferase [Arcobacter sp.]|nr:alpha-1,2-fucosyltransferase [Arcobacter sp.]|tara:strand:- start:8172 stop:9017 length:846 start_codon:yes stop_codon:yes gene_type:complete